MLCLIFLAPKVKTSEDDLDDFSAVDYELSEEDRLKMLTPFQRLLLPISQRFKMGKKIFNWFMSDKFDKK